VQAIKKRAGDAMELGRPRYAYSRFLQITGRGGVQDALGNVQTSTLALQLGMPVSSQQVQLIGRAFPVNDEKVSILGRELRLVSSSLISEDAIFTQTINNAGDAETGLMLFNSHAVLVIELKRDGVYEIAMHALEMTPAPVEMALGVNGIRDGAFVLTKGDGTWTRKTISRTLSRGFHTIDVWFLNDAVISGQDRNAVVKQITIEATR
jgi:hypothetical protein